MFTPETISQETETIRNFPRRGDNLSCPRLQHFPDKLLIEFVAAKPDYSGIRYLSLAAKLLICRTRLPYQDAVPGIKSKETNRILFWCRNFIWHFTQMSS